MSLSTIHLKPLRPHRYGHPWVYTEEIARGPEPAVADGSWVTIVDHNGKDSGIGYYNSRSKITLRRVADAQIADGDEEPTLAWWTQRIQDAADYRADRRTSERGCYRLIHAEGDGIPGLIADVYGEFVVLQLLTLGIDRQKELIVKAIERVLQPLGIYDRSDVAVRKLEGLEESTGVLSGDPPPDRIEIKNHGIKIFADIKHGGKTGLFLDQMENHIIAARESKGRDVLNVFSYTGLFGLRSAMAGAKSVEEVESSAYFLEIAKEQWDANKAVTGKCKYQQTQANAFDDLRRRESEGYLCDMVILDPPAFTKTRAGADSAARGYNEINRRALKLIRPGGVLVTCSCTHHIDSFEFISIIDKASRDSKRPIRLIERRGQGSDHPILLHVPETDYLKCMIFSVK